MPTTTPAAIAKEIEKTLKQFPAIKLAILFGSLSQGTAHADSDIDVAVAADTVLNSEQKTQLINAIAQSTARPVDLIDLQQKREPVFGQAITKGKLIFCHDHKLYAELIKTVMFNAADFLPYRSRILKERRKAWINN